MDAPATMHDRERVLQEQRQPRALSHSKTWNIELRFPLKTNTKLATLRTASLDLHRHVSIYVINVTQSHGTELSIVWNPRAE